MWYPCECGYSTNMGYCPVCNGQEPTSEYLYWYEEQESNDAPWLVAYAHKPESVEAVLQGWLVSEQYQTTEMMFHQSMGKWSWYYSGCYGDSLAAEFACSLGWKTALEHDRTREQFERNIDWQVGKVFNHCFLNAKREGSSKTLFKEWWVTQYPRDPFPFQENRAEFGERLRVVMRDAVEPKIKSHPRFRQEMEQLFVQLHSEHVQANMRSMVSNRVSSDLDGAVTRMKALGMSPQQMIVQLRQAIEDHA